MTSGGTVLEDAKVSVIVPVYNCDKFIAETIECVCAQTYSNWEMLLVDDCSPDGSAEIITSYAARDERIRYIKLPENSGAAVARNTGLSHANGRYIAYLDADDLWRPQKLERQLAFMSANGVFFTCCDYDKIREDGSSLGKVVHMPKTFTYEQLLRNTIIQTVGVVVDRCGVNDELMNMPNVRRGQDMATWLQILKSGVRFMGQNEVLASYRTVSGSLSSNKFRAMQRTWNIYRNIEKLSLFKSLVCMAGWAWHACLKRIYIGGKSN